jgi:hypothetical protein
MLAKLLEFITWSDDFERVAYREDLGQLNAYALARLSGASRYRRMLIAQAGAREMASNRSIRTIENLMFIIANVALFLTAIRNRGLESAILLNMTMLLTLSIPQVVIGRWIGRAGESSSRKTRWPGGLTARSEASGASNKSLQRTPLPGAAELGR